MISNFTRHRKWSKIAIFILIIIAEEIFDWSKCSVLHNIWSMGLPNWFELQVWRANFVKNTLVHIKSKDLYLNRKLCFKLCFIFIVWCSIHVTECNKPYDDVMDVILDINVYISFYAYLLCKYKLSPFCPVHPLHWFINVPDSKFNGASMGPTWVLLAPDGPHVGPMNLAIRDIAGDMLTMTDRIRRSQVSNI